MSRAGSPSAIDLFDAALRLKREERAAYLLSACGGDPGLHAEVESLLKSMENANGFLDKSLFGRPIVEPKTPTPADGGKADGSSVAELMSAMAGALPAGAVIGRYTVERVLGEGGMGVVYLAQQEKPRRAVALKVIRPALATPTMLARFVREAELLGRLQHPGIAQIFEAGTAKLGLGGAVQPYLAIEFVRGEPITDHARRQNLALPDRLALVARLCDAVEHAHQRGLIHRDLKPANILVDAGGQPKILDFGVARAVDSPTPGATLATEVGTLIGTLAYMSPEQVRGDSSAVDTRSDIYGLGVILYELVCGKRPLDTGDLGLFEAARQVREREPEKPGAIRRELRGDVETIILKAMAKDRERRYPSAGALREDLRRHLAGEPILARQDSAIYVLRKTIRRHRGPVAAAVLAVVGLAAFGVYASVQSRNEHDARLKAEIEKSRADRTSDRLAKELYVSNVARGRWLMDNGTFQAAEDTLWREQLQHPESNLGLWALRDLYARHPSLLAMNTHNVSGRALAMSRDGGLAAVGDAGGRVTLWRLSDGARLGEIAAAPKQAWGAAMSANAERLATIGDDGMLKLWSIADPEAPVLIRESLAHLRSGTAVAYSPDGSLIATVGGDRSVGLFDGLTGVRTRTLIAPGAPGSRLLGVAFDDSGTRLAAGGEGPDVFLADLGSDIRTMERFVQGSADIQTVSFSHDGKRLLAGTGGATQALYVWDIATRALLTKRPTDNGTVRSIELSNDDQLVLTTGYWRSELTSLATGLPVSTSVSWPRGSFRARFMPGEDRVLVTGGVETRIWERDPKPVLANIRAHSGYVGKISASADGTRLFTVSADGSASLWDTATWREVLRIPRTREFHCWVGAISTDGRTLVVLGKNGAGRLYSASDGSVLRALPGLTAMSADCTFTEDGRHVIGADIEGRVVVWRTSDGVLVRELQPAGRELFRLLRLKGDWVAAAQRTASVPIWDAVKGDRVFEIPKTQGSCWCLAVSPDATRLAVGFFHGGVEVWDLERLEMVVSIDAHSRIVRHLAFSNDGRAVASTAGDGPAKLWDAQTGLFLARLGRETKEPGPTGQPANLVFIPNSSVFITAYDDGRFVALDTAYFDRHIAGNLEFQLARQSAELRETLDPARARAWGAALLAGSGKNQTPGR